MDASQGSADTQANVLNLSQEQLQALLQLVEDSAENRRKERKEKKQGAKFAETLLAFPGDSKRKDSLSEGEASDSDAAGSEDDESSEIVGFSEARNQGAWELSTSGEKLVSKRRLDKYLTKKSYGKLLKRNPEPKGGFLKTQKIDAAFVNSFSKEAEKIDKDAADCQRGILNGTRPLLAILKVLDGLEEKDLQGEFIEKQLAKKIRTKISDAIQILNHEAERTRVQRRKVLAQSAKWPQRLVDICDKIDNEDEGELFGQEFRAQLHEEAKIAKYSEQLRSGQTNRDRTKAAGSGSRGQRGQNTSGQFSFGRGRGYNGGYYGYARGFESPWRGNGWRPRGTSLPRGGQGQKET